MNTTPLEARATPDYAPTQLLLTEVVGLAGVGKTTLARALAQQGVRAGLQLKRAHHLPFVLGDAPQLLPALLAPAARLGWGELRSLAYLRAWQGALREAPPGVICLDQGPVFRLALLRLSRASQHPRFQRWWAEMLASWATKLALIVWLDAPDAVLVERINAREKAHALKGGGALGAHDFLVRFRRAFTEVIAAMRAQGGPVLLHIDTHATPLAETTERVLTAMGALASPASPAGSS